jgi:hypothetical protein
VRLPGADNDLHRPRNVAAGNQQMEVTMSTSRPSLNNVAAAMYATVMQRRCGAAIFQGLRNGGPYLLIELLLPGGTLMVLLLYLYRNRRSAALARIAS